MDGVKKKVLVLFSPSVDTRADLTLTEAEAEEKGVLFDQERIRKLEVTIDQCAELTLVIYEDKVPARLVRALRYAAGRATLGEKTKIKVFVKADGLNTHPSIKEIESEFRGNEFVDWYGFADEILFDAAVSNHASVTKSALGKIYRAKSQIAKKEQRLSEAIDLRKKALELDCSAFPTPLAAADHLFIGMRYIALKEYRAAEDEIMCSIRLAKESKATTVLIGDYEQLALIYLLQEDPYRAEGPCLEAVRLEDISPRINIKASLYRLLGRIYKAQRAFDKAEEAWKLALALSTEAESLEGMCRANILLGRLKHKQEMYKEAIAYFKAGTSLSKRLKKTEAEGHLHVTLAGLYGFTRQRVPQAQSLKEARNIFSELKQEQGLKDCDRLQALLKRVRYSKILNLAGLVFLLALFAIRIFELIRHH